MNAIRILFSFVIVLLSCLQTTCAYSYVPNIKAHSVVEISKNWDLKGKSMVLPVLNVVQLVCIREFRCKVGVTE